LKESLLTAYKKDYKAVDCITNINAIISSENMELVLHDLQSNFMVLLQKNMKPIMPVHAPLQQ